MSYVLHPTSVCQYVLRPMSYILHHTSYILRPTSYILHATYYVLRPTPFALHHMPSVHHGCKCTTMVSAPHFSVHHICLSTNLASTPTLKLYQSFICTTTPPGTNFRLNHLCFFVYLWHIQCISELQCAETGVMTPIKFGMSLSHECQIGTRFHWMRCWRGCI